MEPSPTTAPKHRSFFNKLKHPSQFSKPQLAVFVLAFAIIGYLLVKAFATAPLVATLQAEQMTPSGGTAASSGFITSLKNNGTITTPYLWTFNPGTDTSAGYFFANGKLLKKIDGPGPYVLRLNAGMLKAGTSKLGHAWDTATGVHQTPPTAYLEKINNVSGRAFVTSLTNNMTINAPYLWAFDPGTATNAGYFFADGTQLAKETGPGPYVLLLEGDNIDLSAGTHQLGHAWDTTTGVHQTPPSAYAVTYNPDTGSTSVNSSVISDATASGGQAVKFGAGVTLTGSVNLASQVTSLTVMAHGEQCSTSWPQMNVKVDGQSVLTTSVTSTSWTAYNISLTLNSGSHTLTITNTSSGSCLPSLYADVTNLYGPNVVTNPPTVSLSASPSSVNSGQSSTLTWNSINATSCTASGAWSGGQATSGSVSTGALNQSSTYTLTCTGTGGTASASATVSVTASTAASFLSLTSWARPAPGTPSAASSAGWRLVPFSTKTGLDSAISNMQGHDYIYYNGTGVLNITATTGSVYSIASHNPSLPVVIDFGTSHDMWDSSMVTPNYVHFSFTGTAKGWDCFYIHEASNLRIFGGDIGSNLYGGGIRIMGNTHDVTWWDFYVHNIGGSGVGIQPITQSGVSSSIQNLNMRGEVNRFALNPSLDPHADKGTGEHGVILHGNSGYYDNSSVAVYAHDSLRPGEVSVGLTWPEGGGGSAVEAGTDSTGGPTSQNNDKYYVKGENLLMIPNGTNPGSTSQQTGGNVINNWGSVPLNGNDFVWIEGINTTGAVMHGTGGGWFKASPAILVEHGRHSKTDQTTVGQSQSVPYYTGYGINYKDIL